MAEGVGGERTRYEAWLSCVRRNEPKRLLASVERMRSILEAIAPSPRGFEPYGRLPLFRSDEGEVMLAGWHAGERCAPHDHGSARGLVVVVQGTFTETAYRFDGRFLLGGSPKPRIPGDVLEVAPGTIHDLEATSDGITLHVYSPAIEEMRVFDAVTRTTLVVADGCGAWIPEDSSLVVARHPWSESRRPPEVGPS